MFAKCSPHPPLPRYLPNPARGSGHALPVASAGLAPRCAVSLPAARAGRHPARTAAPPRMPTVCRSPPAARQARAPRQPGRARKGGLARLFRRRPMAALPEQSRQFADLEFTAEAFPALSPEARAFFNTPLEECDPAMLGVVLGALAELIAGAMAPREGMRDVQDVFLALSSRMAAVTGEAGHAPPAALPEVAAAPADLAATAAIDPQAALPESPVPARQLPVPALHLPVPAPRPDSAAPPSEGTDVAQGAAAAVSGAPDQPATAPAGPQPSGPPVSGGTSTQNARAPDSSRVPRSHARRRLFRDRPGFATRSLILPQRNIPFRGRSVVRPLPRPARLLCYAACAGPPARLRRA